MDKLRRYIAEHEHIPGNSKSSPIQYECPKCKDKGYILVDIDGYDVARECECSGIRQAKELMRQSGISEGFLRKDFKNFDIRNNPQLGNAKNKAIQYTKDFSGVEHERHNSIMFSGQVGSGKTHLGIAVCNRLMRDGVAVIYMAYRTAVTRIKQYITDDTTYNRELKRYMRARVLYIDDFLKGKLTEADVNIMYELINHRYMNNLPIIVSTEKSLDQILEFDEAIGSRIIEMCRKNIIDLQGKELNYRIYS